MNKRGRPTITGMKKDTKVSVALDQNEYAHLYYVCERLEVKPSEFFRYAIEKVFEGFIEMEREEKERKGA